MTVPHDIDFHLQYGKHGWSYAMIRVDDVVKNFTMTHVFSNPLFAICESAHQLSAGIAESVFFWHDEPGTFIWKLSQISEERHLLNASISEFPEILHSDTSRDPLSVLTFVVARDFWIQHVVAELEKISKLLSFRHFQAGRSYNEFPSSQFSNLCASFKQRKSNRHA